MKATFTRRSLLELIVVVIVIAALAAVAIPTFAHVIARSHDEVAKNQLIAMQRAAWATAAMDRTVSYRFSDLDQAKPASGASAPGIFADGGFTLDTQPGKPSTRHGQGSWAPAANDTRSKAICPPFP